MLQVRCVLFLVEWGNLGRARKRVGFLIDGFTVALLVVGLNLLRSMRTGVLVSGKSAFDRDGW